MKLLLILLTTVLLCSGCLTGGLTGTINKKEEIGSEWRDVTLNGRKADIAEHLGNKYQIYEFCGFKDDNSRILQVWLPLENGSVLLKEHRDYYLRGNLPITMECVFGVETNFKGRFFQRVDFNGDPIKIEYPAPPKNHEAPEEEPHEGIILPQIYQAETEDRPRLSEENLRDLRLKIKPNNFFRPKDSGDKWYLLTTRLENQLTLSKRTGTRYSLSTPERSFTVNPNDIDYEYRSWLGIKLMNAGYIVTVPVDIVITPVIVLGVICIGFFSSVF